MDGADSGEVASDGAMAIAPTVLAVIALAVGIVIRSTRNAAAGAAARVAASSAAFHSVDSRYCPTTSPLPRIRRKRSRRCWTMRTKGRRARVTRCWRRMQPSERRSPRIKVRRKLTRRSRSTGRQAAAMSALEMKTLAQLLLQLDPEQRGNQSAVRSAFFLMRGIFLDAKKWDAVPDSRSY